MRTLIFLALVIIGVFLFLAVCGNPFAVRTVTVPNTITLPVPGNQVTGPVGVPVVGPGATPGDTQQAIQRGASVAIPTNCNLAPIQTGEGQIATYNLSVPEGCGVVIDAGSVNGSPTTVQTRGPGTYQLGIASGQITFTSLNQLCAVYTQRVQNLRMRNIQIPDNQPPAGCAAA